MTPRKDGETRVIDVGELLTSSLHAAAMRFVYLLLALAGAHATTGCAMVAVVGAVGSAGVSAVSTAGSVAASGAGAALSGASSLARSAPRIDGSDKTLKAQAADQ